MRLKSRYGWAAVLLAATLVSACQSTPLWRRHSMCASGDDRPWTMLRAPPPAAVALGKLADENPYFAVGTVRYRQEAWFALPDGQTMLCRTDRHVNVRSWSGEWWQFREEDGKPILADQGAWLTT